LDQNKARTWPVVFADLEQWVNKQCGTDVPIFISHNTFRADKPIMELECSRYNMQLPLHWYFFDSLHYSRRMIKNATGNYSLTGLHEQLFNKPIMNAHRARNDVSACTKILNLLSNGSWQLVGPIYPSQTTSLRSIRWVGQKAEEVLYQANIRSVEQLLIYIQNHGRQDFILTGLTYELSICKSLTLVMGLKLPHENVKNIAKVLVDYINH
jgi:DNA polymerase III epsilon subunit-like protein